MTYSSDRAAHACAAPRAVMAAVACLFMAAFGAGCVYRISIQQGNYLDPKALEQLSVGMTRSQVRYLLGTPMVPNTFDSDRWDYLFYYKRGRTTKPEERQVTVYFEDDKVARIERPGHTDSKVAATTVTEQSASQPASPP